MSLAPIAERALADGDPDAALIALQEAVKAKPADAKLRIFLFQLLCVLGRWERALNQLDVACQLDALALAMAQTYREAIACEMLRAQVFEGRKTPMVFGEPEPWLALLVESLLSAGRGLDAQSRSLRQQAFDQAATSPGTLDGQPFQWIADADSRLGPVLETVINGRYYWVPFARLARVDIEEPSDLRDQVWMPTHLMFENGGEAVALIPTRYPCSESCPEGAIRLARRTEWRDAGYGCWVGLGQRILTTDADEKPLMDVRRIDFTGKAPE